MNNSSFLLPLGLLLGLGGFAACWFVGVKMLALAGWQRLAQYRATRPLSGPGIWLGRVKLGSIQYKNVIQARVQAEGLGLEPLFLFRIGHPPLLIPWAAIGPVRTEKVLWSTMYITDLRTDAGGSVPFAFANDQLATELRARLRTAN